MKSHLVALVLVGCAVTEPQQDPDPLGGKSDDPHAVAGIDFTAIDFTYGYCVTSNYQVGASVIGLQHAVDPARFRSVGWRDADGHDVSVPSTVSVLDGSFGNDLRCVPRAEVTFGTRYRLVFERTDGSSVTASFAARWQFDQSALPLSELDLQIDEPTTTVDGLAFDRIDFTYGYCVTSSYESGASIFGHPGATDPAKFTTVHWVDEVGHDLSVPVTTSVLDGSFGNAPNNEFRCIPTREIKTGQKMAVVFSGPAGTVTASFAADWLSNQSALPISGLGLHVSR